jgi:Predicted membrane protein
MKDKGRSPSFIDIVKASFKDFSHDQCTLRAAALCYYTVFAIPPLLIVVIAIAGVVWGPDSVQRAMESQFAGLVGAEGGRTVREMLSSAPNTTRGIAASTIGIAMLLLGATGAFLSLQQALNAVWNVKPDPKQGGIRRFITKRLLSFGMVLGLAFLMVVSLALTAFLTAIAGAIGAAGVVMEAANAIVSLVVLAVLFAAMFKFLPDAEVRWRSVWVGGIATAILLELGKLLIGLYLAHSNPGSAFGTAKVLAVILVWLYYAGILILFGAEFTQHYAEAHGHPIGPKHGAIMIEWQEKVVEHA